MTKQATTKKKKKNGGKNKIIKTFFNPEIKPIPDRKPTFEQKNKTDPDRLPKVNLAGHCCNDK
jgi:hypothetical protein